MLNLNVKYEHVIDIYIYIYIFFIIRFLYVCKKRLYIKEYGNHYQEIIFLFRIKVLKSQK